MPLQQLRIEDIAASGQHHTFAGTDVALLADLAFDLRSFTTTRLGTWRLIQTPLGHQLIELLVAFGTWIAFGQHHHLHAQYTATVLLAHQALDACLRQCAGSVCQCGFLQRGKERRSRLPLGHHAMTARRRLLEQLRIAVGRHRFVARVVQIHAIGRIGSLVRRHGRRKGSALLFQPVQVGHAVAAEARQSLVSDHTIDLMPEVGSHGFG